jgi:hypothetical protein
MEANIMLAHWKGIPVFVLALLLVLATGCGVYAAQIDPWATSSYFWSDDIGVYSYTVSSLSYSYILDEFYVFAPIDPSYLTAVRRGNWQGSVIGDGFGGSIVRWMTASPDQGLYDDQETFTMYVNVQAVNVSNYDPDGAGSNWAFAWYPLAGEYWGGGYVDVPMLVTEPGSVSVLMMGIVGVCAASYRKRRS